MVQKTDEVAVSCYCDVCDLVLNGSSQLDDHIRGKKHRSKVKKKAAVAE